MPINYEDIGLNEFLQPIASPISNIGITSAYDFQSSTESGAINTYLVKSISADKIGAGTITVSVNLGSAATGTITLDGANNRIVIHDGTTNRIVIGEV